MSDNAGIKIITRIILISVGAYGILHTITSSALPEVSDFLILLMVCIYSLIYVVGVYNADSVKRFFGGVGVIFAVFAVIFSARLINGLCYIYNDCMYALERPYGLTLQRINITETDMKIVEENIALMFIAFVVVFMVTLVVVYVHNMIGALLSILPVMILFISMAAIPDVWSFFLCVSYVFGVSALHGYEGGERQALTILSISTVVFLAGLIILPSYEFQRLEVFDEFNQAAKDRWAWVGGANSKSGNSGVVGGGIGNGILGDIEGLCYTNEKMFTLTTIDTGKNQYFKSYIGKTYSDNRWKQEFSNNMKNGMTEEFIDLLDRNSSLHRYVTGGSNDYYALVRKFPYNIQYVDGTKESGNYVDTDITDYSRFKNAAAQLTTSLSSNYKWKDYSMNEEELREQIYEKYLEVPDDTKKIINGIMGNVTVSTQEQKEYYIKYVKDYLAKNYTYSLMPGSVPEGEDFVEYFLLESKEGYCTYFATAAVLMYRCAGIPARYVEGYVVTADMISQGEHSQTTIYRYTDNGETYTVNGTASVVDVQDNAAHAWAEVYMDGYGWVTVEVTPGDINNRNNIENQNNNANVNNNAAGQPQTEPETEALADSEEKQTQIDASAVLPTEKAEENDNQEIIAINQAGEVSGSPNAAVLVILWIAVILLVIFVIIILRYMLAVRLREIKRKKKISEKYTEKKFSMLAIEEYNYLENIIAFAGYERGDGLEYEAYAGYLYELSDIFRDNNIKEIMELVLKCRFSEIGISEAEYRWLRRAVRHIRNGIYGKLGLVRKFCFKYIKLY